MFSAPPSTSDKAKSCFLLVHFLPLVIHQAETIPDIRTNITITPARTTPAIIALGEPSSGLEVDSGVGEVCPADVGCSTEVVMTGGGFIVKDVPPVAVDCGVNDAKELDESKLFKERRTHIG